VNSNLNIWRDSTDTKKWRNSCFKLKNEKALSKGEKKVPFSFVREMNMTICKRCGTCCEKGGPVLHESDFSLVNEGKILLREIYTIRIGELVWDTVKEELIHAPEEMIKMKGTDKKAICIRYQKNAGCTKYEERPFQCRILMCWDPTQAIENYTQNRLTRRQLIKDNPKWMEFITAHEEILSYERLHVQMKEMDGDSSKKLLLQTMQKDFHFREVAKEYGVLSEIQDFLLGRPLSETIHMFRGGLQK